METSTDDNSETSTAIEPSTTAPPAALSTTEPTKKPSAIIAKTPPTPFEISKGSFSLQTPPPKTPATPIFTATPSLAQIGKQTSVNFRLSQLYDSGGESTDADEQSRLIRTPSIRSHKFIIIPSSPSVGTTPSTAGSNSASSPTFPQTISTSSLATLAGAIQKAAAIKKAPQTPPYEMQQPPMPQTFISSVKLRSPPSAGGSATVAVRMSDASTQTQPSPPTSPGTERLSTVSTMTTTSDIVHHEKATITDGDDSNASVSTPAAPGTLTPSPTQVKFTIEDYDTDQHHPSEMVDPSLQYGRNFSPKSSTPISPVGSYLHVPSAAVGQGSEGLRPRNDRTNNSMRSVVSAYVPGSNDPAHDPSHPFHQLNQYLIPTNSFDGASSCIFRDATLGNQIYSDVTSVRSLASIGIGSTDGHKLVIRRVPHTATELLHMVHAPSSPLPGGANNDDDDDSFLDPEDELKPRQQHWGSKMQFVLACIGYSVGLGNVWRFPYMCYKSGGGVFLVPYCIILFVCSIPLLFMELSVGQYTGRGPIGALGQLCPLFKGAGLASVVVSFLMSTYYSVIIGYSIYYFFTSFRPLMPWIDCNNRWNTPDCWVPQRKDLNMTAPNMSRTPSEEFFENKVLQISPGIEFPGMMRWELFTCLICAWLLVYFATWKSIKSSAKVRYFTATFPFVLIIILLGRAITLEGADEGLRYFFRPNWEELKHANVWINAASQNFNSLGITFGSMISFASYNKYNNNILRDTIAVSVVNIGTSLLVGIFAFSTLGNLALEQNTNVKDVIGDGPGLIFVVYPQAMAKMPYAQLWAVMFFFMLLCLGLNSQFAIVEVVVTSIQDGFPNWIKRHLGYHEIVVLIVCVISFGFGVPNLIQGGIYYFQLMDHYAASVTIMFLAFCQMIAVAWFYGTGRLSKNVKQMTGKAPSFYLKSCWILLGPCLLFAIWVLSLVNYKEPTYHNGRYTYPDWAYGIGWMFASFSLVCIPGYAIMTLLRTQGRTFWERVQNTLRPNIYECRICGEHHCEHDFPEQEQYMLEQELSNMYKPSAAQHYSPTSMNLSMGQKSGGYNPMHLKEQPPQQQYHQPDESAAAYERVNDVEPTTSTAVITSEGRR